MFVMMFAGFVLVGGVLATELAFSPPPWLQLLIWGPIGLALCLGLLRPLKALFISLQFVHEAREGVLEQSDRRVDP